VNDSTPSGGGHRATADHPDGLPLPQRYWAILAIALAVMMAVIDGTIANVALPTIAKDLQASAAANPCGS
jgi:DHA2 family multidrug resistance protein-like MFS transporter